MNEMNNRHPSDEDKKVRAITRYTEAAHAMQSGVAMLDAKDVSPKHLRVGINTAMSDHAAIVDLLIRKGIITEVEYFEAIAKRMEDEKARYEEKLGVKLV